MMLHHFREPKHCLSQAVKQSLTDIRNLVKALPETTVNSLLRCHAMSGCDTTSGFYGFGNTRLFKILGKMPTSTAEFYCRQENDDRVRGIWDGYNDCNVYAKLTDTSLLTLRQATTQAVSEHSSPEERSCTEKGQSQTAPSNFLGCEVSLPPGVSSNTRVAVQSFRSY